MKKILALVLAMMVLAASMTIALADPTNTTITVPATDSHTYAVYQIFTGELSDGVLSNIHWGAHGTGTPGELVAEDTLKAIEALKGTDTELAAALSVYANLASTTLEVNKDNPLTVPTGYYLIKDKNAVGEGEEQTLYIVQVVGPTEIARKASTTTSEKKLDDKNDSDPTNAAVNATLDTSSDYDIGDFVPYHVTATISSKADQYKKYHITLEDILESGKFDEIRLDKDTITLDGAAIDDTDDYTVTTTWNAEPTKDGFKVTYEFTPKEGKTLASLNGKTIAINFSAKLGVGASIGADGNKNTLKVKYSNNPNNTDGHEEGTTPDKVVITFTYKVVVDKFEKDEENKLKALAGAGFTLYKVSKTDAETGVTGGDAKAKNTAWAAKKLTDSKGEWTTSAAVGETAGVANRFSFNGIDDGYYVLCETTTPAGYNTMDPIVFKVEATHGGDDGLTLQTLTGTDLETDLTKNVTIATTTSEGKIDGLKLDALNQKGSTLPSTGGMGTTILYIGGSILVILAAVLLITKRRMSSED